MINHEFNSGKTQAKPIGLDSPEVKKSRSKVLEITMLSILKHITWITLRTYFRKNTY